jgi:hypothetical protein
MTPETDHRRAAAKLLTAAWEAAGEAEIPSTVMTATALSVVLAEMVRIYGEDTTSRTLSRLSEQVGKGAFNQDRHGHRHDDRNGKDNAGGDEDPLG